MDPLSQSLATLLAGVRLQLEPAGDGAAGWIVGYEAERHPLSRLPLDDVRPGCERGELMAAAAGIEAAIKYPGQAADTDFLIGAQNLLPKVERRRFVDAYAAILAGRGDDPSGGLLYRDLGADLVVVYVREEGFRFSHITHAQHARWGVSPGTVDAGARSSLYHRADLPWRVSEVQLGDGYDAARAVIVGDVFYHLATDGGVPVAIPGRDLLLVGAAATPERVATAYETATYPISPEILAFSGDTVRRPAA